MSIWVQFHDMYSGGGLKEDYNHIFIEAETPEEAEIIFQNRFGHNPNRITCTCCGHDYSIRSNRDLAQLTGFERGCAYDRAAKHYIEAPDVTYPGKYLTLEALLTGGVDRWGQPILVIRQDEIKKEERVGELRESGWVWAED